MKDIIHKNNEIIDQLDEELQRKTDKIDQLNDNLDEMRRNLTHNSENDTAAIYEQEFERVKEAFEDEKRELAAEIHQWKYENDQLKQKLVEEIKKAEEAEENMQVLEKEMRKAREENLQLHHLKSSL